MKTSVAALIAPVILCIASCTTGQPQVRDQTYTPVLAPAPAAAVAERGSLKGDFDWAASARTIPDATRRWEEFLQRHTPPNGEYEDAFQKRHIDAGRYELMRAYYLLGEREKGDAVLKDLDPLQLR